VAPEPARITKTIKFGEDFELDAESYTLSRAGRVLKLERIPMDILLLLVGHRGQLVDRDQIAEKVWGKGVFLDTDNSINIAISKIRQTLKDDPEGPRFIQTIPGRGYRFIAPVETGVAIEREETVAAPAPQVAEDRQPALAESTADKPSNRRWLLGTALLAVLIAVAGIGMQWWRSSVRSNAASGRAVLAVLPFANLTGDASQDYFSDGLTEEMITQLGRVDPSRLGVIARTSVMNYKGARKPLNEVGRELGVEYVLEGSVRRDGGKVRVTAQLIQLSDQTHLWAQEYDRELRDILVIQSDISEEIASEIERELGAPQSRPAREGAMTAERSEAYDFYLKGLYFFNKRSAFPEAIQNLQQAVARDPQYALAYALLADSYTLMGAYQQLPASDYADQARAAALRAVELDDRSAEAHTALALIVQNHDYDWKTSEQEFRRAIALDPNYATAHQWYAEHLMWLGRFDEALAESERARQLDPLSLIIATDDAYLLYTSRQYDRAIKGFRSVLDRDPGFARAYDIGLVYLQTGQCSAALNDWNARPVEAFYSYWARTAYLNGRCGAPEQARKALARVLELEKQHSYNPTMAATAYLGLGDKEKALEWLGKAYQQRSNELTKLKVDPIFDPLRNDPRFQDLLRRVGLDD
jgi:TolB-like protein/DNA-binding winged helix-turn-helix (wHTH) protein/Tfp pilus assembly protein PilF